jgi:hypothetical protein
VSPVVVEILLGNHVLFDWLAIDQMFLNDAFQDSGRTVTVPSAIGHDRRNRATFADATATHPQPQNATFPSQPQFFKPTLKKLPRFGHLLRAGTACFVPISAQQECPRSRGQLHFIGTMSSAIQAVGMHAKTHRSQRRKKSSVSESQSPSIVVAAAMIKAAGRIAVSSCLDQLTVSPCRSYDRHFLPTINLAPRRNVKNDHAQLITTNSRFLNPVKK